MGLLSASQWPAQLIPMNMNGAAAIDQTPTIDQDLAILNNPRLQRVIEDHRGVAQYGSPHAEPAGGR